MTQPAVEIETKLKSDAALKSLSELRKAIQEDLTESLSTAKITSKDLAKELVGSLASSLSPLALVGAAVAGVGAAYRAMGDYVRESITAASESEEAELKLTRVLALRGELTEENKQRLLDFNEALERSTDLDADNLLAVQGTLSSMGVMREDLERVTLAVVGFSEKFGKDLPEAAQIVGKAIVENSDSLRKYGIDVKDSTQLVNELAPAASLAGERLELLSGRLRANETAWGNLSEAVGGIITQSNLVKGTVSSLTEGVRALASGLEAAQPYITGFMDKLGSLAKAVAMDYAPGGAFFRLVSAVRSFAGGEPDRAPDYAEPIGPEPAIVTRNRGADEAARKEAERKAKEAREKARRERLAELAEERRRIQQESERLAREFEAQRAKYSTPVARAGAEMFGVDEKAFVDYQASLAREKALAAEERKIENERLDEIRKGYDEERTQLELDRHHSDIRAQTLEQRYSKELEVHERTKELKRKEVEWQREHYGQLVALSIQGTTAILGNLLAAALAGEKIDWGGMFGGLLVSVGQAALAMGTAGLAAATLGTLAPWLAPTTGGAAAIGPSLVLMAAGAGAIAAGTLLGGAGKGRSGATVGGPRASIGGTGGFAPSSPSTPLGFQAPNAPREPQATVINVSFTGLMQGSERGLGREIGRVLRVAGTLGGS